MEEHESHGNTLAAWVTVVILLVGSAIMSWAVAFPNMALFIGGAELDANFKLAAQNIPNIDVLPVQGINVYDILRRSKLVLSKAAVEALEERFK